MNLPVNCVWGQDSSVGIAIRYVAGRSGDRIPVLARYSPPVQTGPGAHPVSCTMGTGSLDREKSVRSVVLTTHRHLASRLKKE